MSRRLNPSNSSVVDTGKLNYPFRCPHGDPGSKIVFNSFDYVQTMCGAFGCQWLLCKDCYEGHLLECHMFAPLDDRVLIQGMDRWRINSNVYDAHTVQRAKRGRELCGD